MGIPGRLWATRAFPYKSNYNKSKILVQNGFYPLMSDLQSAGYEVRFGFSTSLGILERRGIFVADPGF